MNAQFEILQKNKKALLQKAAALNASTDLTHDEFLGKQLELAGKFKQIRKAEEVLIAAEKDDLVKAEMTKLSALTPEATA